MSEFFAHPEQLEQKDAILSQLLSDIENQQDHETCNNTMSRLMEIIEKSPKWMEPYFYPFLPSLMDNMGNFKTSEIARETSLVLIKRVNSHSIRFFIPMLYQRFQSLKWQTKKGALMLLGSFSEIRKEIVQRNLPSMILELISMTSDVKKRGKGTSTYMF